MNSWANITIQAKSNQSNSNTIHKIQSSMIQLSRKTCGSQDLHGKRLPEPDLEVFHRRTRQHEQPLQIRMKNFKRRTSVLPSTIKPAKRWRLRPRSRKWACHCVWKMEHKARRWAWERYRSPQWSPLWTPTTSQCPCRKRSGRYH